MRRLGKPRRARPSLVHVCMLAGPRRSIVAPYYVFTARLYGNKRLVVELHLLGAAIRLLLASKCGTIVELGADFFLGNGPRENLRLVIFAPILAYVLYSTSGEAV